MISVSEMKMSGTEQVSRQDAMSEAAALVRQSIEQSMKDLLGEDGAKATFFHLGMTDYDNKTKEFHVRMCTLFRGGTPTVERMIVKDLFNKLDIPFVEGDDQNYEKSVEYAMKVARERIHSLRRDRQ